MDTYAFVARLKSIRLLMALSVKFNLAIKQIDVIGAIWNGNLNEQIYKERLELLKKYLES